MRRIGRIAAAILVGAAFLILGFWLALTFGREPPSTNGDLVGADPVLPQPDKSLIPTINFSQAEHWPAGQKPIAPNGFKVTLYAAGLDQPRWLYVLPNGDVVVAEASTSP